MGDTVFTFPSFISIIPHIWTCFRYPSTFKCIILFAMCFSSLRIICSYLLVNFSVTSATFRLPLVYSFLILFKYATATHIHLNIHTNEQKNIKKLTKEKITKRTKVSKNCKVLPQSYTTEISYATQPTHVPNDRNKENKEREKKKLKKIRATFSSYFSHSSSSNNHFSD